LKDRILRIRENLEGGIFANEQAISQAAVLPILDALSWPIYEPDIVWPEFTIEGKRADFALCHPRGKPQVLLEVKQLGQAAGADRQLFEYAFHHGVPVVVLTDGQEWNVFLPAGVGDYTERRVYKLDLIERTPEESADQLRRYLEYAAVCSGKALEDTQYDYRNVAREREIRVSLPEAWRKLIEERDEKLIELLADKVATVCGYKADLGIVHAFLQQIALPHEAPSTAHVYSNRSTYTVNRRATPPFIRREGHLPSMSFVFNGQTHTARSGADLYVQLLKVFADRYPDFLEKFSKAHSGKRRFVAQNRYELFPNRRDIGENSSRRVANGWWAGLNMNKGEIYKRCEIACRYGRTKTW
jgi:hypothetical protein